MSDQTIPTTPAKSPAKSTTIFGREPVAILAIIQTGLALIIGFGLDLTPEQTGVIMAFSAAVLGFLARTQVSPVKG